MKIKEIYPDVITEDTSYEYKAVLNPDNPIKWAKTLIGYANDNGFSLKGLTFSPITGGEGNIEFLGYFVNDHQENSAYCIDDVVSEAHKHFNESR